MRHQTSLWRAGILGTINGFLYGGAVEIARQIQNDYEEQKLARLAAETGVYICMTDMLKWYAIPVLFTLVFAVVSLLLHKCWVNRPASITRLWVVIGLVSALAVVVPTALWGWWSEKPLTLEIQLTGVFLFALAAGVNLLFGSFIHLIATYYQRVHKVDLP